MVWHRTLRVNCWIPVQEFTTPQPVSLRLELKIVQLWFEHQMVAVIWCSWRVICKLLTSFCGSFAFWTPRIPCSLDWEKKRGEKRDAERERERDKSRERHICSHTHVHFNHSWQTSVQTHQFRSAFSAGCVKRAIKVYTEQLATTRCTSEAAEFHEAYEIKQKSGPAFQSQSLALLQHRSFLNLAVRQKKGLCLIWSKDCTTYFSQTDVQSERRWVQKSS